MTAQRHYQELRSDGFAVNHKSFCMAKQKSAMRQIEFSTALSIFSMSISGQGPVLV